MRGVMSVVWWLLAVVHIVPLTIVTFRLIASPNWADALSLALLLSVTALFTAKALNARWLRTDRPLLECVVWLIAGSLAHGDVAVPIVASQPGLPAAVAVAGGAACLTRRGRASIRRGRLLFDDFIGGLGRVMNALLAAMRGRTASVSLTDVPGPCFVPVAAWPAHACSWSARPPPSDL
ncbi:MAG: hypothetical protein AAF937_01390 [Planctomycetota bacterium]